MGQTHQSPKDDPDPPAIQDRMFPVLAGMFLIFLGISTIAPFPALASASSLSVWSGLGIWMVPRVLA